MKESSLNPPTENSGTNAQDTTHYRVDTLGPICYDDMKIPVDTFMGTETRSNTATDFEKLPEGPPCQLIDGELLMTPSPSYEHQNLVLEIATSLREFVRTRNLGSVVTAPMDVYLTESYVYQPDIMFISSERQHIIHEKIKGAPDIIVEVLSPSNASYDLGHKKEVYGQSGVKEYWIVDPVEKSIEVCLNREHEFALREKTQNEGVVRSSILTGFSLQIGELFSS